MAGVFEVELQNLDNLVRQFEAAPRDIAPHLQTAMTDSVLAVQRTATANAPSDTGNYRRSFSSEARPLTGTVSNRAPYAEVVEFGRRAGAPMPPPGVLLEWMRRHGIEASAEFAIRRAIARRGIPAKRVLNNALDENRDFIAGRFQTALREFAQTFGRGR